MAFFDPLTDLPNRSSLLLKTQAAIMAANQQQPGVALLHMEIGRVHEINKVLGYRAGDELLQHLARRLAPLVATKGTLARVGDAAFAVLLATAGGQTALGMARRLVPVLRVPVDMAGVL